MRGATLLAWLLTAALSYFLLGGSLAELLEGQRRSQLSPLPLLVTTLAAGMSLLLTWRWSRQRAQARPPADRRPRRDFLLSASGGLLAVLAAPFARSSRWFTVTGRHIFFVRPPYQAPSPHPEWAGSRVVEYRRLGRTEARVSDISLGSGSSTGGRQTARVAREAIERGINYFDTAPDYSETGSEKRLGEAMRDVRDQMFVATKFCRPDGHLRVGTPVREYMEALEASLRRLGTDRVDLVHIHSCDSVERLMDENTHEAFDRLKEQGKVRFLGVSTHTPNLEAVAHAAIDSDRFDVMMLAYHHGAWPQLEAIVDRAAENDIGVVAMKTLRGAKHQGLLESRAERDSYTQAAFKWVLANPSVACLVISLWQSSQLDEFLFASGKRPTPGDLALLDAYDARVASQHCRPHCGICLPSCPEGLPIHDVLRHRMYFEDFGAEKTAMQLYAALDVQADVCAGCSAPCAKACPDGIPIPERIAEAHRMLRLG